MNNTDPNDWDVTPLRRQHELTPHVTPNNAAGMSWAEVAAWFVMLRVNVIQTARDVAVFYGLNRVNWFGLIGVALVASSAGGVLWLLHLAFQNLPWYVEVVGQLVEGKS